MSPIRPENADRYPADWYLISERIRYGRAKGRCECDGRCGYPHEGGRCPAVNGQPHPRTGSTVVLTVAHLDHTPENCAPSNLRGMCQACHLAYDADHHAATARRTTEAAWTAAGQQQLIPPPPRRTREPQRDHQRNRVHPDRRR